MRIEEGFQIPPYEESHPYLDDPVLPYLLRRLLPLRYICEVEADLKRFGDSIIHEYRDISSTVSPPQITQFDHLGRRIDRLDTSEGWRRLKDVAIREGIVAIPHERKQGEFSRIYGFAKLFIFAGDSHLVLCPMAMTDGAARVLELIGTEEMKRDIRTRLISRDPAVAFTSGQWMTERPGGSDISQTETTAKPALPRDGDGGNGSESQAPAHSAELGSSYFLDGLKWFSSATDSNISIALARTGSSASGSRGLSLFLVPLRLPLLPLPSPFPTSNGIFIHRLKNKIGTHALPTAELSLNNTQAYLLGSLNEGVKSITPVLNVTRVYSAVTAIGYLRRALDIARSYALVRNVTVTPSGPLASSNSGLGSTSVTRTLRDIPLHMAVLANTTVTYQALTHFTFNVVALLGKHECGEADENEEARLRFITPVLKAFVSEGAVAAMQECMTCLGGLGYMEEVGIGRLIRDGLVEEIWEGTTNVLALDMIRASNKAFFAYIEWSNRVIASLSLITILKLGCEKTINSLHRALTTLKEAFRQKHISSEFVQRPLLYLVGHTTASLYLLEHVAWEQSRRSLPQYEVKSLTPSIEIEADATVQVFKRYVGNRLESLRIELETWMLVQDRDARRKEDLEIVYRTGLGTTVSAKM